MKRRHHTPEQIVRRLREADRMLGEGQHVIQVCKHLEITEQMNYRWRN
jgi:putative transposase